MRESNVIAILDALAAEGIKLRAEHGDLRYLAPAGALSAEYKAVIRERKGEILEIVRARSSTALAPTIQDAEDVWLPTDGQVSVVQEPLQCRYVHHWPGDVDVRVCEAALNAIIERHSVLRTRYVQDRSGRLWAATEKRRIVAVEYADLSHLSEHDSDKEGRRLANAIFDTTFRPETTPRLRFALLKLAPRNFVSVFAICHSLFDGWSSNLFFSELYALYLASLAQRSAQLPPLKAKYSDHARSRRAWLESDESHQHVLYWRDKLTGSGTPFWLPTDRVTPSAASMGLPPTSGHLAPEHVEALRRSSRESRSTVFIHLLTALGIVLGRWTGRDDALVWIMHSGRQTPALHGLIGMYADCCLFRMTFTGNPTFSESVARVRAAYMEALPHFGATPMSLRPILQRAGNGETFPGTVVNFLPYAPARSDPHAPQHPLRNANWLDLSGRYDDESKFAINFILAESASAIAWKIRHKSALFEDETIRRFSTYFGEVLETVSQNPQTRCGDLPPLR